METLLPACSPQFFSKNPSKGKFDFIGSFVFPVRDIIPPFQTYRSKRGYPSHAETCCRAQVNDLVPAVSRFPRVKKNNPFQFYILYKREYQFSIKDELTRSPYFFSCFIPGTSFAETKPPYRVNTAYIKPFVQRETLSS